MMPLLRALLLLALTGPALVQTAQAQIAQAQIAQAQIAQAQIAKAQTAPAPSTLPPPPLAVPEALRGTWFRGECDRPEQMLHLTMRSAARVPEAGVARLFRFSGFRPAADWIFAAGVGPDTPRLLLRGTRDALDTAEPDPKLRDDRLPGDTPPLAWHRCPQPPLGLALQHAEGLAFLAALEQVEAACLGAVPGCLEALRRQGDVNDDGALSLAELARLLRGAGWALAVQRGANAPALLAAAPRQAEQARGTARLLLESLDYDADGRISAAEMAQDRLRFGLAPGAQGGTPLPLEALRPLLER